MWNVVEHHAGNMAALTVTEAEARLDLDWSAPLRHMTFYKAVFRPAVLRANRMVKASRDRAAMLPTALKFHALRHTYASISVAADIRPIDIAELMGHRDVKTTLTVYAHLINTDDHAGNMAALGALGIGAMPNADNVIRLRG